MRTKQNGQPKKTRGDATVKNLDWPLQEELFAFLSKHNLDEGPGFCREHFGFSVSATTLSQFYGDFPLRKQFREMRSITEHLMDVKKLECPEMSGEDLDSYGQRMFSLLAIKAQDSKTWARIKKIDADKETRGLDRQRFQRETCELFVKWLADKRAKEIATSSGSNAEKIERLGELMFGETWK